MCRSPRAGIVWRSPKMVVFQIIQNSIRLSLKPYDIGDAPFWEITIMIKTFSVLTRHVTEFEILNFIHEDSASIWRVSIRVCRILWKTVPKISTPWWTNSSLYRKWPSRFIVVIFPWKMRWIFPWQNVTVHQQRVPCNQTWQWTIPAVMAMATSYNLLFLWDYTFYKWGFVSTYNS